MHGHIDCYLDVVSFYSYMALIYLRRNRAALDSHGITVEFHPIFLGGVNVGSGNKPPWTLPAKAVYGAIDGDRAKKYHGTTKASTPPFFPILSLLPQRSLCYIKAMFPPPKLEETFLTMFHAMWEAPHLDLSKPNLLRKTLIEIFTADEADTIIAAAGIEQWKNQLTANTQKVLKQGAFGAPWHWVTNREGDEQPFFGSDRYHFMWEFLGLPWEDIRILPKSETRSKI